MIIMHDRVGPTYRSCMWILLVMAVISDARECLAADRVDSAVAHPGRSAADLKRDALDHPAELLRLSGIGPGMRVADVLGADGYFSELCSYLVTPQGQVLLINNAAFDKWSDGPRQVRLAGNRLSNVEHRTLDLNQLNLGSATLDAIILSKVYHDLYWVDPTGEWPVIDTGSVLDQLVHALKPGGVLLLIDHAASAGHGSADASTLHRIEQSFARQDFERRGMRVVGTSELLRRPEDPRTQISYKSPILGKTDRFVMILKKN
jgi:predicted methyltransferase